MKKNQRVIAGIAAIVVGVGIIVAAVLVGSNQNTEDNKTDDNVSKVCPMSEKDNEVTVNYDGVEGETALATLEKLCDVTKTSSDLGEYVTGIEDKDAGDEYYWAFYVNDGYASEGAGTYKAEKGDEIKWVLTSLDAAY
ncbi:MAG: DUF4430 domain-containing protein [Candidatus Saccharimonadales bacterium]